MSYARILFYNFLIVFFVNHLFPGIDLLKPTKIPHFGSDIPFAVALGLLNSLVYPVCKLINQRVSMLRVAVVTVVLNFAAYAILQITPIGIRITSLQGYFLAGAVVTVGSLILTYLYMRAHRHHHHHSGEHETHKIHTIKPDDWTNPPS